ncbi:MAG: tRNA (guanosine(37)-N1)-methyltransferase TrmD [Candidatus Blackburnbacteria bacterium RIFCSPHIGHO2_01_FULL_44_64]|uniref:tRNA (guanine-N(1)-)-methyltransferase n=1 Tax=Candidatus Blackburnbacteria bacterium RIFCSPHIGHO2_02_FULL_44_20 TaxID=1797516 RepID=A0A1G1V905_9BACT|nr:MAG: tRNA (guanosine(37)-N1)-methyltransferase TrmD [Candidatus Blackburnbacteria bacterium RIFCSPHIGHO2_01_FULL_44_64]OGY11249.1 MAG: tRNA (guanosine(37)-N1)-methyltransferase TrmD [Candidatus Blackburnbacteria bacterium RIFCSPHIGHO2_12_FULL_44_25]OGY11938.1 MAG: tRNA (guanosine(37)-N1)-methyltransferase TrmD [Candidatus Blackburnbacteria bacterium RIFCSPHIGHO2_02_FULL_44_20]OGY13349.1 MAG: tRNA (guanosine(37)-N1)-methyltransferase TrmD [Candidatus Blackburnbacteria bacterium RIFCSPLOWO2_01_
MRIDMLTLFPEMFEGPFRESIIKRAQDRSLVEIKIHNLRGWAEDKHHTVDDRPYGGGTGMLLMVEPIARAMEELKRRYPQTEKLNVGTLGQKSKTILLDPGGKVFNQKKARELSKVDHLILIAAHYETVDQRVRDHLIDEEISIGDYVLTGGELPAMVLVDTIVRLLPGVLTKEDATTRESFENGLLEYPQYTRPEDFRGWKVPEVLLSGDHKKIETWKEKEALARTKRNRPDLLEGH